MNVLVMGANTKPEKYAYKAMVMLKQHRHTVKAIGLRPGEVEGIEIETSPKQFEDIDTVTLYLNPGNQEQYRQYIVDLKPRRVIFNPGTENFPFEKQLEENGIEATQACTLVLLATGQF